MKKIMMGMVLAGMSMSGWAACSYNLGGTMAGMLAFPSVTNQKATFVITPTTTQLEYAALNPNFDQNSMILSGDIQFVSNGIVAFELDSTVIPTDLPDPESIVQVYTFLGVDANNKPHYLSIAYSNNTAIQNYERSLVLLQSGPDENGNSKIITGDVKPYSADVKQNIGVYINQNSNQYGLIINDVNQGYVGSFSSQIKKGVFKISASIDKIPANSTNIGKPLSVELITDRSKMKNTYPTGTTDICGNVI